MPISVVARTVASATGTTSISWPSGHQVGDIGILVVQTSNQPASLTSSGNFQYLGGIGTGTAGSSASVRMDVWWARATSASMGSTGINDAGDHVTVMLTTYRGCIDNGEPYDTDIGPLFNVKTSASTTTTWPATTTTVGKSWPIWIAVNNKDSATIAWQSASNTVFGNIGTTNTATHGQSLYGLGGQILHVWNQMTGTGADAGTSTGVTTAPMNTSQLDATCVLVLIEERNQSKSDGDTGSSTESQTVTALVKPTGDTGTGTEAATQAISTRPTQADTGTGTETQTVTALVQPTGDTGQFTESQTVTALVQPTGDTGTATETAKAINTAIGDDAGQFAESISPLAVKPTQADAVTGTDTAKVTATAPTAADGFSWSETGQGGSVVLDGDAAGPTTETARLTIRPAQSDTGKGTDVAVFSARVFGTDAGLGTDTSTVDVQADADTGTGTDNAYKSISGVLDVPRLLTVSQEDRRHVVEKESRTRTIHADGRRAAFGKDLDPRGALAHRDGRTVGVKQEIRWYTVRRER